MFDSTNLAITNQLASSLDKNEIHYFSMIENAFYLAETELKIHHRMSVEIISLFEQATINLKTAFQGSYWNENDPLSLSLKKIFLLHNFGKKIESIIIKSLCLKKKYQPFNNRFEIKILSFIDNTITKRISVQGKAAAFISLIGERTKLNIFEKRIIYKPYQLLKNKINNKEKLFFHLLGNDFEISELESKQIEFDKYCGNIEIFALNSWRKIIKWIIKDLSSIEQAGRPVPGNHCGL